ncbi:MAG: FkbM family methyltransferase [Beijerinckiaceae bacterium]|nr:FkbM family methyltransferase [Beijerinckiaceae bacterium]MCZ8301843.1 FkbM family methyltransferase [Beijerinckiaceae bacterium]
MAEQEAFVSYAQNFEDVILWRALRTITPGHYIDIGANDPVIDSVSFGFYERGWRGCHVEPMAVYAERLRAARPDEIVVEAAVGPDGQETTLFEFAGTGMTTARADYADTHGKSGFEFVPVKMVTRTLASIFEAFPHTDIHWLKVDVEGMERAVIESWGDHPARPWIVVLEMTLPNSTVEVDDGVSDLLSERGYRSVYFDGLNRFFLHESHNELAIHFGPGPNVFDRFRLTPNSAFVLHLREQIEAGEDPYGVVLKLREAFTKGLVAQGVEASDNRVRLDAQLASAWSQVRQLEAQLRDAEERFAGVVRELSESQRLALVRIAEEREAASRAAEAMVERAEMRARIAQHRLLRIRKWFRRGLRVRSLPLFGGLFFSREG